MTFHQPKNRVWRDGPPILSLPFFKGEIYHPGRRGAGLHANMLLAQVANFYKTFAHGEFIKSIIKLIMCHHQTCNSPDQTKPYGFSQWSTKFLLTTIQDPTMINTVQIHIYIYIDILYTIYYIYTHISVNNHCLLLAAVSQVKSQQRQQQITWWPMTPQGKNHLRHNQQFEGIWIPNHFVASMRRQVLLVRLFGGFKFSKTIFFL